MKPRHTNTFKAFSGLAALALMAALPFSNAQAQCSSLAWSGTTGTVAAIGPGTTPAGLPYEGNCGLTVAAANAPAHVTTSAPLNESLVLTRFYLYPDNFDLTSGDADIFRASGNGNPQVVLSLRELGEGFGLVTRYRSGGALLEHGTVVPLRDVWQAISMAWNADPIGGSLIIKIDGRQAFIIDGLDNGDEFIADMDLGLINAVNGTGQLVMDAFEARRENPEPPLLTAQELFNISTRAQVGNGAFAVVGGFVILGDTPKCVTIRGRGPSMNVPVTKMEDPTLTLRAVGNPTILSFNDNWQEGPDAALISTLGNAPPASVEAAIYACLEPGGYTADLRSVVGQDLGLGIIEVLDSDEGTAYLRNISTRSESQTGAQRVIAGFVIRGDQPREVLVRGRGPSVGVPQTRLGDPTLDLRFGQTQIAVNDDWQDNGAGPSISSTGLAPPDSTEAAIRITLDPGNYTAILASGNGTPGIGIVEVYDLTGASISSD